MRQPKRTASRLLSALLGLIMLLSLLPTVTLAAERVPEELKAIKVTSNIEEIAQFRHPVQTPTFEETTGKPVKFKTDPEWWRYNETTGKYERYTGKTFKEGKYKFFIVATITGSDYDQYQFASSVTATVNGTNWKTTGSAIDPGRKLSRILMVSPEYTIEGRQLVNRIVLTSNMEEILAQKEGLDTPYIQVRSAFTTASVGFMSSVMPRIRYSMADFASTANSSSMQKLSICIMKSPLLSFIQSVSRPLYNSIVLRHSCTYSVSSFTSDGASTLYAIFSTSRFMRFIRGMTLEAKNTFARCSMFRLL